MLNVKKNDPHAVTFDVMEVINGDDRYVCTLTMPCNRLFAIPEEDFREYAIRQRPSLAHRNFKIAL